MVHLVNWKSVAETAAVLATVLLASSASTSGATINAGSPSYSDVAAAIASASDGDTVVVPAGTASWTSTLTLTKGITLMGATTTDPVNRSADDQTIILDNVPRQPGTLLQVNCSLGQTVRISGFTFKGDNVSTIANNGSIHLGGNCHALRLDHCHFRGLYADYMVWFTGWVFGVVDHNLFDDWAGSFQSIHVWMDGWGGGTYGEGSWEAATDFGSENFVFIEDNCINNTGNIETTGTIDALRGGRYVLRYNHLYNIEAQSHGTEGLRDRGIRAVEIYNNDFHWTVQRNAGQIRGGVVLTHDNTWDGVSIGGGLTLQAYRTFVGIGPWNGAHGANGWDLNDTEGDGTNVPGHSPYLFDSGTATSASISGSIQTIIDTSKNWTPNQWAGFGLKNTSNSSGGASALIQSNTSNTLICYYYTDSGGGTVFSSGNGYEIHRVLVALDQPGRGRCRDVISGNTPVNVTAGNIVAWPHQDLEPCYSWNDMCNGLPVNLRAGLGPNIIQENRDYYNNTPMPGYTPYTYPHPLVSGGQGPESPGHLRILP